MPASVVHVDPLPRNYPGGETAFSRLFEAQLKTWNWHGAHFRHAYTAKGKPMTAVAGDGKGWPDWFCIHRTTGDMFAVELKNGYNKPEPAQDAWLQLLDFAGIETHVWWPPDWPAMVRRLSAPRPRWRSQTHPPFDLPPIVGHCAEWAGIQLHVA